MNIEPELCRVDDGMETISGKWKMTILLYTIQNKTIRFSDYLKAIPGITQRMLTKNLRELEDDDLISRKSYPTIPPRVEYSITDHGMELAEVIDQLHHWGIRHRQHIMKKWMETADNE